MVSGSGFRRDLAIRCPSKETRSSHGCYVWYCGWCPWCCQVGRGGGCSEGVITRVTSFCKKIHILFDTNPTTTLIGARILHVFQQQCDLFFIKLEKSLR